MKTPLRVNLFILLLTILCLITGCQYQFGRGELSERYSTISIPYVNGDQKGELTADLIKTLSQSGAFRYMSHGGDLILQVKLIDFSEENIDFRYDRKRSGKLKKSMIPTETRVSVIAEVTLIESGSNEIIRGPTRIAASTDFDHTYYATRHQENILSMGQLNDIDAAREAAMYPLNRSLAEKIVDYVMNSW